MRSCFRNPARILTVVESYEDSRARWDRAGASSLEQRLEGSDAIRRVSRQFHVRPARFSLFFRPRDETRHGPRFHGILYIF